jgi:hypothetical protein
VKKPNNQPTGSNINTNGTLSKKANQAQKIRETKGKASVTK